MSHITGATLLEYWCWSGCGWDTAIEIRPAVTRPSDPIHVHAAALILIPWYAIQSRPLSSVTISAS